MASMLNYPIPELDAGFDFQIDLSDFSVQDDVKKSLESIKGETREILQFLHHVLKEKNSRRKTAKDINVLLQEKTSALQKKTEIQKALEQKEKVKKQFDKKKELNNKVINLYGRNLGFYIESPLECSEENCILFVFENISKSNPEEKFFLKLKIDGRTYAVVDCKPAIDTLDELLSLLIKSNDLRNFILKVRRKWITIANI